MSTKIVFAAGTGPGGSAASNILLTGHGDLVAGDNTIRFSRDLLINDYQPWFTIWTDDGSEVAKSFIGNYTDRLDINVDQDCHYYFFLVSKDIIISDRMLLTGQGTLSAGANRIAFPDVMPTDNYQPWFTLWTDSGSDVTKEFTGNFIDHLNITVGEACNYYFFLIDNRI